MAHLNKVLLIGRLTRDPEVRSFSNGGKVASFGFAINNRKKDGSGEWVDDPCFIDMAAFNANQGRKLADIVEEYFAKGKQAYVEGRLVLEQWDDKNGGGKRSKLKVVVDNIQLLENGGKKEEKSQSKRHEDEYSGSNGPEIRRPSDGSDIPF
jgi:single-strand DNA-binding protein